MKIALIPAKLNSTRLKNKNFKLFHGKPMIYWSIESARNSKLFDKIVVSTDSKVVKNKLLNQINIESINIEDKSFIHKNHKTHDKGKFHIKLTIESTQLKQMNKVESTKKIYKKLILKLQKLSK